MTVVKTYPFVMFWTFRLAMRWPLSAKCRVQTEERTTSYMCRSMHGSFVRQCWRANLHDTPRNQVHFDCCSVCQLTPSSIRKRFRMLRYCWMWLTNPSTLRRSLIWTLDLVADLLVHLLTLEGHLQWKAERELACYRTSKRCAARMDLLLLHEFRH